MSFYSWDGEGRREEEAKVGDVCEQSDILEGVSPLHQWCTFCHPPMFYSSGFHRLPLPATVLWAPRDSVGRWGFRGWIEWVLFLLKLQMNDYSVNVTATSCNEQCKIENFWVLGNRGDIFSARFCRVSQHLPTETSKKGVLKSKAATARGTKRQRSQVLVYCCQQMSRCLFVPLLSRDHCWWSTVRAFRARRYSAPELYHLLTEHGVSFQGLLDTQIWFPGSPESGTC